MRQRLFWTRCLVLAVITLPLLTVWGRAIVESRQASSAAQASLDQGNTVGTLIHLRHGAQWKAPFGDVADDALRNLIEIGEEAERSGDFETALVAYRAARHSIMARGWMGRYARESLPSVHERIAHLMALTHPSGRGEREYLSQLDDWESRSPRMLRRGLATTGFVSWLVLWTLAFTSVVRSRRHRWVLVLGGACSWSVWLVAVGAL